MGYLDLCPLVMLSLFATSFRSRFLLTLFVSLMGGGIRPIFADLPFDPLGIAHMQNCQRQQRSRLIADEKHFEQRLVYLIGEIQAWDFSRVRREVLDPESREYRDNDDRVSRYERYRAAMIQNFRQMLAETQAGLALRCVPLRDRFCRGGDTIAYVPVLFGSVVKRIHFCPLYFESGESSQTFFHELSHYAAGSDDFAHDWWSRGSVNLDRAVGDAYHIEAFWQQEPSALMRHWVWNQMWRVKRDPKAHESLTFTGF